MIVPIGAIDQSFSRPARAGLQLFAGIRRSAREKLTLRCDIPPISLRLIAVFARH